MEPLVSLIRKFPCSANAKKINDWLDPIRKLIGSECSQLVDRWMDPIAQFVELGIAQSAQKWLDTIAEKEIAQQLRERRISEVRTEVIAAEGELFVNGDNFQVSMFGLLKPDENYESHFFILGHELAHTFHFDFQKSPLESVVPINRHNPSKLLKLIELFSDKFARKWVDINGREKLRLFFENEGNEKPITKIPFTTTIGEKDVLCYCAEFSIKI